jgi:hypothetical protein
MANLKELPFHTSKKYPERTARTRARVEME